MIKQSFIQNKAILILILLLVFAIPNAIAYKIEQKRIEEERIREGLGFFGPDIINAFMNAISTVLTAIGMSSTIVNMIMGFLRSITGVVNLFAGFARMIISVAIMGISTLSSIFMYAFAAFAVGTFVTTVVMIATSLTTFTKGITNHINCGAKEFKMGWVNTFKTLGIMIECSWDKFINFLNGNCTRYYITDMILGLLYGIFIQLPLLLINAIFGINLQPIVDFLYKLIVVPADAMFYAVSGFHLVNWPDSVINECYRCKGKYTFANNRSIYLYKRMNEWAKLFDCSTEQIKNGFVKIFTSIVPSQKWTAWADADGTDDEILQGWNNNPEW